MSKLYCKTLFYNIGKNVLNKKNQQQRKIILQRITKTRGLKSTRVKIIIRNVDGLTEFNYVSPTLIYYNCINGWVPAT